MPYLLLDLAKLKKSKKIPYKHAKVGLLVTLKQAKKLITPEEPHAVYVLPEKKAANSIVQAALDILNAHPDCRVAIVSPRSKVHSALTEIQANYPDAKLALFEKTGKKVSAFLKQQDKQPEPSETQTEQIIHEAEEQYAKEGIARSKENADASTLAESQVQQTAKANENEIDPEIQAALMLFKKNRPKKKNDLVRMLSDTQHSNTAEIHDLVVKLQQEGHIYIDAAENVRYDVG